MSTLFVAATGGHLDQLHQLAGRLPPGRADGHWVTFANAQSRSLLAGRDVSFVPYVGVRDVRGVVRCLLRAHRLWRRHEPTRVVSTGSGIALAYLPYLAARGVRCHYIESAARVRSPSVTGRILRWTPGVRTYCQYPGWRRRRWHYIGSVFDAYAPAHEARPLGEPLRVVITLGTATEFPFRRLVEALVPLLAPDGPLARRTGGAVDVLWQTGGTPTGDLPIRARPFLAADELAAHLRAADIVIGHAGAGSALAALEAGRRPLLAARRVGLGEIGDDHQRELAGELARRGLALVCEPQDITVEHLLSAAGAAVRRLAAPPVLCLRD